MVNSRLRFRSDLSFDCLRHLVKNWVYRPNAVDITGIELSPYEEMPPIQSLLNASSPEALSPGDWFPFSGDVPEP